MAYPALGQGDAAAQLPADPESARLHLYGAEDGGGGYRVSGPGVARRVFQGAGTLMSLAIIGLAIWWGYKQTMRDLHGVPVVQALDGPTRVAPEDPGGMVASHAGLAVNEVRAGGSAGAASQQVALAPAPVDLAEEDVAPAAAIPDSLQSPTAEAADMDIVAPSPLAPISASLSPDDPIARAVAEAAGITLQDAVAPVVDEPRAIALLPAWPAKAVSPRPVSRPTAAARTVAAPVSQPVAPPKTPVDVASIPAGTRLVQLGAFDSPEDAQQAWAGIAGKFTGLMADKDQVVLEARAGGRSIWRLRAMGFEDLADARRFCAALVAERTDCIPVVAR